MGNNLFGANISGALAGELGPLLPKVKLLKKSVSSRTAGSLTSGRTTSYRGYTCRGIVESFDQVRFDNTETQAGDRVVLILGDTLPKGVVPAVDDRIEAEGQTLSIVAVMRDPDAATYSCLSRN